MAVEIRLSPHQREDAADKIVDMLAQHRQLGWALHNHTVVIILAPLLEHMIEDHRVGPLFRCAFALVQEDTDTTWGQP